MLTYYDGTSIRVILSVVIYEVPTYVVAGRAGGLGSWPSLLELTADVPAGGPAPVRRYYYHHTDMLNEGGSRRAVETTEESQVRVGSQ